MWEETTRTVSPLFSPRAIAMLKDYCKPRTLFSFDFDGTLTGIVARPEKVGMAPQTIDLLEQLEKRSSVAVISGRRRKNLRVVLPTHPSYLIGNHGVEAPGTSPLVAKRARRLCQSWFRKLVPAVRHFNGVQVENKLYSLSVHYRHVKGLTSTEARERILEICRELRPLPRFVPGKSVWNVLPPDGPDKGKALLDLMRREGFRRAIYVGDDDTDEDVFALREAQGKKPRILTVRVGKKVSSKARFFLRRQSDIDRLLKLLNSCLTEND